VYSSGLTPIDVYTSRVMTAIRRSISLGAFLVLALAGCGPAYNFAGHWIGYRNTPTNPGADPAVVKSVNRVEIKIFDKGNEFVLFERGLPKQGLIQTSGQSAKLQIDQLVGSPIPPGYEPAPIELKAISKDKIEYHDPAMGEERVTLERQPQ
jgi:hypothetical protein